MRVFNEYFEYADAAPRPSCSFATFSRKCTYIGLDLTTQSVAEIVRDTSEIADEVKR